MKHTTDLKNGTVIKFTTWNDGFDVGVIIGELNENGFYTVKVNNRLGQIMVEPSDIVEVVDTSKRYVYIEDEPIIEEEPIVEVEPIIEEVKSIQFQGLFADGGLTDKVIDNLPNELSIYVPLFNENDEPASDKEIETRVNEVKNFLQNNFGEFVVQNYGSSYIDQDGNLIMKKHIQITSYPSDVEFENNKMSLISKLSIWAKEWEQSYMVLEFEDDMFYILPTEDMYKKGGELWIQGATQRMSKKGTIGAFVKQAKREGLNAIEFAKKVLKSPKGYTLKTRRRANFVKNANPDKF
jgi:hypothetical protein